MVTLSSITFNHDPGSTRVSALNARVDETHEIPKPEIDLEAGRPVGKAVYSMADTHGALLYIRVKFQASGGVYEIRSNSSGVLGKLDPETVDFGNGPSKQEVKFHLKNRVFVQAGRHNHYWNWEYREKGSSRWLPMHPGVPVACNIYLLFHTPGAP